MRHFLAARPIATRPIGMHEPPPAAALVTSSGSTLSPVPGACGAVPARRSGRGRSSCRSGSGCGNRRTETAALIEPRGAQTGRRHVDERHDCRDIGPAYVSSTVWGTASMRDHQVGLGAVLALRAGTLLRHSSPRQAMHAPQRLIAPDTSSPIQQSPTCLAAAPGGRYHPTNSGTPRQICAGPRSHRQKAVVIIMGVE
jgi:hypothetical protein